MAKKQLYYEDVEVGSEVTTLPKIATTQMLVRWAGASGDFNPHHYDDKTPLAAATGGIIVHGALKRQWLVNLVTDWMGDKGWLKKFSCQYRALDFPRRMMSFVDPMEGETWLCKGTVANKYVEGDEHLVDCDIWVENAQGQKTTPGSATVVLPSKKAKS
jgi:hypothetical protein